MSQEPLFPKKSETSVDTSEAPPIQIERSDDPSTSLPTSSGNSSLPSTQGKKVGCGSSVFVLMLIGVAMLVAGSLLL